MIETTYDKFIGLIIFEKEKRKITSKRLCEMVGVSNEAMSKFLSRDRFMPADVMFACLVALGYKIEVHQ